MQRNDGIEKSIAQTEDSKSDTGVTLGKRINDFLTL